jgi:hypothetical protein
MDSAPGRAQTHHDPNETVGALEAVRVLLVNMPQLLHDIVRSTLATADGVTLVAELDGYDRVVETARSARADVIVCAAEHAGTQLLSECPRARIVAISDDGAGGFLYELRPCRRELGAISPTTLVDAVRGEAAP